MKNHIKNLVLFSIVLLATLFACTKFDGYYDYVNKEKVFNGNSYDYLQSKPGVFDSLLIVIDRFPYLKEALNSEEVTIFAPTNSAFQTALSNLNLVRQNQNKPKLNLRSLNQIHLDTLITKYIVHGKITTDSMEFIDGLFVETYNIPHPMHAQRVKEDASGLREGGMELVSYSDTKGNSFQAQWVRTNSQAVNVLTQNGVVHILGGRHEFGFGDFLTRMNK